MLNVWIVARRELSAYFTSPLAYVFIVIFLALAGGLTFFFGQWLERGQADLQVFFIYHPYLYLFLIPAVGMRLWAEERKSGTIEFLLTLPVTTGQIVIGKFLAAWVFAGIALALTFPMWVTVNMLGQPDNGVILAAYIGSWLMAGGFLALSACVSALTKNQVIAFVLASALCFVFMMSGVEIIQSFFRAWAPQAFVESIAELSFLTNFGEVSQGVIDIRDLIYFLSVIGVALFVNAAIVEAKKGV
ncbi:MAG: ABC transporter permease [Rhodospirillaceae bacterium]|nr:ABC transporter permease [Rhodospirillaceae bacterium]|tara:strand:+ start:941 stop:1675 length:735 start_codon:yes stop_codon:yes gene_type:complete